MELQQKINDAQQLLKDDITALEKVMIDLKTLNKAASDLKRSLEGSQNVKSLVGAASRVKLMKDDYAVLCSTVLARNDPGIFIVNKQLQYHPATPEFLFNSAETKLFVDHLCKVSGRFDF